MKKRIIIISITIVSIGIIALINVFTKNIKLSQKIIDYCNKKEKITFELKLSDYTDFEWDSIIIYKNPT